MKLEAGSQITPSLRLAEKIGEGGMGSVWVADNTGLDTQVAIKFVIADRADSDLVLKRFKREAQISAKIKSPHVVQVFDYGVTDSGTPYIVMELLEGKPLDDYLAEHGRLSGEHTAKLITQLAKVLKRAHELEIVHRDLKPSNLFLVEAGYDIFLKVLDFGIAKRFSAELDDQLTDSTAIVGTPYFMSPEALRKTAAVDHRADLWAAAVVAYQAIVGQLPFKGETVGDQAICVYEGRFAPPSEHVDGHGEELDAWFRKAFQRDIDQRFQSASELAATLGEALDVDAGARGTAFDTELSQDTIETGETLNTTGDTPAALPPIVPKAVSEPSTLDEHGLSEDGLAEDGPEEDGPQGGEQGARNRWPYAAAALLVSAVVVWQLTPSADDGSGAASTASVATDQSATAVSETAGEAPVASATASAATTATTRASAAVATEVKVSFDATPKVLSIMRDGKVIGTTAEPLVLPRGDAPIELVFSAAGFKTATKTITPNADATIEVRLAAVRLGDTYDW